jgi:hypothetical protein
MKKRKFSKIKLLTDCRAMILINCAVVITFAFVFSFIFSVEYDNLGGYDIWLSGSTIKFVNMWLEEGAIENRFTCYESFDSIEFNTLEDRTPYLSYPTGTVFLVYSAARITGKSHIDISFLKHFQMILFMLEVLFLVNFVYCWLLYKGICSVVGRSFVSYTLAVMWMVLPSSAYYLPNIFYADQAVIFWFMLYILVEYLDNICGWNKPFKPLIKIVKVLTIFSGILIDYYFWILVFVAFVFKVIKMLICKDRFRNLIKTSLWYVMPIILGLVTFLWQLSYTDNWFSKLIEKFLIRTGANQSWDILLGILDYFCDLFFMNNSTRLVLWIIIEVAIIMAGILYAIINKKCRALFLDDNISIIAVGILSTLFQIVFLKNHSASHQFSMLKMGWVIAVSVLIGAYITSKYIYGKFIRYYLAIFVIVNMVIGSLISTKSFLDKAVSHNTYELEEVIYSNKSYNNVYFSFYYSIPENPPYSLSVSEKQVYTINNLEEIDALFPNLSEDAEKIIIVDKLWADKTDDIIEQENIIMEQGQIIYEDDVYCMVNIG